jgi:colanic acid/amylovoran biosynthesis glycosyltransferase
MKILYVVGNFPTLSETFILNQITGLIDRGHEVEIIAYQDPKEKEIHEDVRKYRLLEKTHYILYRDDRSLFVPSTVQALISCMDADIIHAHFADEPADMALGISRVIGIPYIITAHAYDIFIRPDEEKLRAKFEAAEGILTVSQFNRKYLLGLLGHQFSEKITVQYHGVDLKKWTCGEKRSTEGVTVLFIGRLVEKKGVLDAITAFHRVAGRHSSVHFQIIGEGPQKGDALRLIEELDLTERVSLLGGVTQERMIEKMREADIFFLPSVTAANGDREGLPVVILEAQAMGLPVVSTRHTGIPEAVIDGETGYLLEEHDTHGMAQRIAELVENPSLRQCMGRAGRALAESKHDRDQEVDRLEALFRTVVASKKENSLESMIKSTPFKRRLRSYFTQVMEHLGQNIQLKEQRILDQERRIQELENLAEGIRQSVPYRMLRKIKAMARVFQ